MDSYCITLCHFHEAIIVHTVMGRCPALNGWHSAKEKEKKKSTFGVDKSHFAKFEINWKITSGLSCLVITQTRRKNKSNLKKETLTNVFFGIEKFKCKHKIFAKAENQVESSEVPVTCKELNGSLGTVSQLNKMSLGNSFQKIIISHFFFFEKWGNF